MDLAWLESQREYYDSEAERLRELEEEDPSFEADEDEDYHGYYCKPSKEGPENDVFIEWTYTFDLDRLAFTVDGAVHFRLDNIPREEIARGKQQWIEYLSLDGSGSRCLALDTPKEFIADISLPVPRPLPEGLASYEKFNPMIMQTTELSAYKLNTSEALACVVAKGFIWKYYNKYSQITQYSPGEQEFSHAALGLLYAASPGMQVFVAQDESKKIKVHPSKSKHQFAVPSRTVWYRGRMIQLSSHLDNEDNLRAEVGSTVTAIREKGLENCTSLLWSVQHVVIITVSGDDVAHSAAIPVLAAYGSEIGDNDFTTGLKVLAHHLQPSLFDSTESEDQQKTAAEPQHLSDPANKSLPMEVFEHILKFVDREAYFTCTHLSHACRAYCLERPRVGPYILLRQEDEDSDVFIARVGDEPSKRMKLFWNRTPWKAKDRLLDLYIRFGNGNGADDLVPLSLKRYRIAVRVVLEDEEDFNEQDVAAAEDFDD